MRQAFTISLAVLLAGSAQAAYYQIGTTDEIKQSAATLAYDMSSYYKGNQSGQILGILPGPPASHTGDYYWYAAGAMFGTFIDYWHATGDDSYNRMVMDGMIAQIGEQKNYEPANWSLSLGNDDQAFWGMAALSAAESRFPNPPADQPTWIDLAHTVWNMQQSRIDNMCGGGLHWQARQSNAGWDYKNTVANAMFVNLGARLARYTGNDTFVEYADQIWDWMWGLNYIDHKTWSVYDGGYIQDNCKTVTETTFTTNGAALIEATAYLYNYTQGADRQKWGDRLENLLDRYLVNNFNNSIAYEPNCEPQRICNTDQKCMKGYSHRWLSVATQLAPQTKAKIQPVLQKSVEAAVAQCTGGPTGRKCGFFWRDGVYVDPEAKLDLSVPTTGACETMSVFGAVTSMLLIESVPPPVTLRDGGISNSTNNIYKDKTPTQFTPITTADKAGAAIVTIIIVAAGLLPLLWADR